MDVYNATVCVALAESGRGGEIGRTELMGYAEMLSEDMIRALLKKHVETDRKSTGIVAYVLDNAGHRLVVYRRPDKRDETRLDSETVVEVGSITKVLTALLLADMVERGEVALNDPVGKYLPEPVKVPDYHGRPITLLDLASYTSGLPRFPDNVRSRNPLNPYVDYTVDEFYGYLTSHVLRSSPGVHFEYSNIGFSLLGHALAHRAGRAYEDLLIERICEPLGLKSTRITLTAEMRSRMAQGHNRSLEPTPVWDLPAFAGAGAVRSTANDLLVLLEACLGRRETPLGPALALLLEARRTPTETRGLEVGLGWCISADCTDEVVWKDGWTGGFTSFIGFSTGSGRGAVVLTNVGNCDGVRDMGMHLINADYPAVQKP
jgi:CubicO group peptidase (beta-lactamase class C family)